MAPEGMKAQRNQTRSRPSGKPRNRQIVGSGSSASAMQMAPSSQNLSARRRGGQIVRHRERERIGSVAGSVSFGIVGNYAINPALSATFPWLSGVAQHYESYTIENLVVRYKNLKGTDADGNIIISYDPDTLDAAPSTAVEQTQSCAYVDGAVWRIFEMRVPAERKRLYTRTGPIIGTDLKTYDAGRVWVSAEGCADTSTHGYLELEYDVVLHDKQSSAAGTPTVSNYTCSQFNLSANTAVVSGNPVPFDEVALAPSLDPPTLSAGVVTLVKPGWYHVLWTLSDGGTASLELQVDGAAMSPPVLTTANPCSGDAFVQSDGTTTVQLMKTSGASSTFYGDYCRISFIAL